MLLSHQQWCRQPVELTDADTTVHEPDSTKRPNRSRTDASAGWRDEYRHAHAALPDGGRYLLPNAGARVRDRDTDDEHDTLIVITVHAETAAEDYEIDELDGATVADVNPDHDPGAPVVEAVYADEADEQLDGWRSVEDLRDGVSFGAITAYSFPVPRLARDHGGAKTETGARSSQEEAQPGRDGASGRVDG